MSKVLKTNLFLAIALFLSLLSSSSAWQIGGLPRRVFRSKAVGTRADRVSDKALKYRSDTSEEDLAVMTAAVAAVYQQPIVEPNAWDLPRHSPSKEEVEQAQLVWDTELFLGRIAMMISMVLLVEEVSTGLSFSDQLAQFLR